MTLPRSAARPEAIPTILVVENEHSLRGVVCRVLGDVGACTAAETFAGAIEAMERAPADLVILDGSLDGEAKNGCALARDLLRRWPGTRVLFLSGYYADELRQFFGCPEGIPLLVKPFFYKDLMAAVAERLAAPPWYPIEWREQDGGTI